MNELYHYGIPGMKWGVRKEYPTSRGLTIGERHANVKKANALRKSNVRVLRRESRMYKRDTARNLKSNGASRQEIRSAKRDINRSRMIANRADAAQQYKALGRNTSVASTLSKTAIKTGGATMLFNTGKALSNGGKYAEVLMSGFAPAGKRGKTYAKGAQAVGYMLQGAGLGAEFKTGVTAGRELTSQYIYKRRVKN